MGIKNLSKLIKDFSPNCIKSIKLSDLKYKKIVLDASLIIYQYVIAIRSTGADLLSDDGKITTHILGIINKTVMLLNNNIIPIYVFDGKAPSIKSDTLKSRKESKKKCIENLKESNYENEDDRIKDFKRSFTITKEQIGQVKEILKYLGIPFLESTTEADPLCAQIVKQNYAYGVLSEDMDILTFGSDRLIRGSVKKMTEIDRNTMLKDMKLDNEQFVDLCILLGCDYTPTIPKIGPKKAYEMITKYKSLEEMLKNEGNKYCVPENFNYKEAREMFSNTEILKLNQNKFKIKKPNYNKFKEVMIDMYDFDLNTVNKYINKIKSYHNKVASSELAV